MTASRNNTTSSGVAVTLVNCGRSFGGVHALSPVNLKVERGETIVLLGPSGCGKTTTLRIMAGLEHPDPGGKVLFDSEDVTDVPVERRNVGIVFQSYALFPNMNVASNVEYGLRVRRLPKASRRQRVQEMLSLMRIEDLAERKIDQLSGGQRQRVALARAIAIRPRVLLLDEPLAALDARLRDTLRTEIDTLLRGLGITSVYVTHDQAEAMALGDRVVVMSKGAIEQIGTPRDIYHRPASAFVANFVGTMNVVEGSSSGTTICFGAKPIERQAPRGLVAVMFRPHDATICALDAGHLQGTVISAQFLGDRTRILIDAGEGRTITVESTDNTEVLKNDRIGVFLNAERLLLPGPKSQRQENT